MQRKRLQIFLILMVLLSSCNLPVNSTKATPEPTSAPVVAASAVSVLIAEPASGTTFPALSAIPVRVQVIGEVSAVELLVDDTPYAESLTPHFNRATWKWTSTVPGLHTLKVRATDKSGKAFTSNPTLAWISDSAAQTTTLYKPQAGDSLDSIAARFNTTPALIQNLNPFLPVDFSAPLPLERPIKILNQYPTDFAEKFPNLVQKLPDPAASQNNPAAQVSLIPEAKSPLNTNSPLLDDHLFVDKTYYYLSLDNGPWSRVPRNQGEFITPKHGFFDLDEVLAPLIASAPAQDIHVAVDAWGWQGGALVFIGRFERVITANQNNQPWAILPGLLEICSAGVTCNQGEVTAEFTQNTNSTGGNHTLRWQAPPGITSGVWQTSTAPFASSCELEPAYLFTRGTLANGGKDSTFTVEFPLYFGEEQTYYARVLPIVNGQPDCTPSNTITLTLKAPANVVLPTVAQPPIPPVAYDIEITDFKPIHFPDYDYRYCVTVVDNPFYNYQDTNYLFDHRPDALGWIFTANGTDICPQPYVYQEPSTWEKIGSFLKEAVNTVAMVYNQLKMAVVELIATINPICLVANQVSDSQSVDDACHAVAEVAVNAAMTYIGLPPSLPNYDELIEKGKGELTNILAEQLAEQTGLPCTEECKQLIRDGLDSAVAEIEAQFADSACMGEKEAHQNGIEPLCIPPDIKVKPMHEGQLEPSLVTVQLTRKADVPDTAFPDPQLYQTSCSLQIGANAENNTWAGQQVFLGADYQTGKLLYWQGTPVSGQIFELLDTPAPTLAPGESTSLTFALNPKRGNFPPGNDGFWLPGRKELYAAYYYGSQLQNYYGNMDDDWEYLYFGASATVNAHATCTTNFKTTPAGVLPGLSISSSSSASDELITTIPAQGE